MAFVFILAFLNNYEILIIILGNKRIPFNSNNIIMIALYI